MALDIDQAHPILVGFGSQSCAQYLENYDRNRNGFSLAYYCWFQGFLSAVNLHRMSVGIPMIAYEATNLQMVEDEAFLRWFCQQNPDQRFVQAALALIARRDAERRDDTDDDPLP